MKRYHNILSLITICTMLFSGCSTQKENYPEFLIEKSWKYEDMICTQSMRFSEDGEFIYSEACGNPVGDSEVYDSYSYNEETGVITLHGCETGIPNKEMQVLRYDERSLMLKMEDGIREFYYDEYVPVLDSQYAEYLTGYTAYSAFTEIGEDSITVAPSGYDADAPGKDVLREVKLAEDVTYFELHIETIITDEEETSSDVYIELTKSDVEYLLEGTLGIGFVWYNENLEIEKIVFYGELIIYE